MRLLNIVPIFTCIPPFTYIIITFQNISSFFVPFFQKCVVHSLLCLVSPMAYTLFHSALFHCSWFCVCIVHCCQSHNYHHHRLFHSPLPSICHLFGCVITYHCYKTTKRNGNEGRTLWRNHEAFPKRCWIHCPNWHWRP